MSTNATPRALKWCVSEVIDMQACVCKGPPWRSRAKLAAVLLAVGAGSITALHVPLEQVYQARL